MAPPSERHEPQETTDAAAGTNTPANGQNGPTNNGHTPAQPGQPENGTANGHTRAPPAGRLRRALTRAAAGLGLGAVFLCALAGGVLLHLDLPPARRTTERVLRTVLDGVFEGTVQATGIDHLGLDGVGIGLVVVHDPTGIEVLRARHVRAEATVPTLLRNLLLGDGDLHIGLSLVRIEQVDVRVEPNEKGEIGIAAAFSPRVTEPAPPPGRPVFFRLDRVEIGAGHVHGRPDGARPLDADLRHLVGSIHVVPGSVAIDVEPTGLTERALLPGPIAGAAEYHLRVFGPADPADTATPSGTRMWSTFAGRVGHVELIASGLMEGAHVELTAHAPRARPEHVKALVPAYPVEDTVALDIEAKGDLPKIDFQIAARTDQSGSLGARGFVSVASPLVADFVFDTDRLAPRAAAPSAPDIRITSKGKVRAEIGPLISVRVDAQTEATTMDGTPVPAVDATAVFDGAVWSGKATVHEPGAPTTGTFATTRDGAVKFDATVSAPSLAKVPRIPRSARLAGAATVRATGQVKGGKLDATVQGEVHGLRAGSDVTVRRAAVKGRVHGPFDALAVDATVTADTAALGGYGVQDAAIRVTGPVLRPTVRARILDDNDNQVAASAVVDARAGAASGIDLRVERGGSFATGHIARITSKGGALRVEGVSLAGPHLGEVKGSLAVVRGEIVGDLHARRLDLATLGKFLGISRNLAGTANADVSLTAVPGGRKGTVQLGLVGGEIDAAPGVLLTGLSADVAATFDTDRVTLDGGLAITGTGDRCGRTIATLRLSKGDGHITGPLLAASTWAGASGRVDVAAQDLDLGCLAAQVPVGLPVSEISGILSTRATLERQPTQRIPTIHDFQATTRYLTIVGPEPFGSDTPPWTSRDLDVEMKASLDGVTGDTTLAATLYDHERVADLSLETRLDLPALADPARRRDALRATHVAGHLAMPRREIDALRTMPSFLRDNLPRMSGEMALDAYVAGSLADPRAVVRVRARDIGPAPDLPGGPTSPWAAPVEVDAMAFYDGAFATLDAHVARDRREVLTAGAHVSAPIAELTKEKVRIGPWLTGRASAKLASFPLEDLPVFEDRAVGGHLSGEVALDGIGKDPSLHVRLLTTDLTIGPDVAFHEGVIDIHTRRAPGARPGDRRATALAAVRFRDRQGGSLDAQGYMGLSFRDGLFPVPETKQPADVYARLARFPVAAAEPFLGGALRRLGGLLDGEARVGWGRLDETDRGSLQADLRLTGGRFHLPQLGQDFRVSGEEDRPLHIVADRTGAARADEIVLRGNTGVVRGSASARLDGMTLRSAQAEFKMTENDPLPVTLEGVELGQLWGTLKATAQSTKERVAVTVDSNDLHLKIPSSSSRDVQSLDPDPDITISHMPEPEREPEDARGRPLAVTVNLDDMVIEGDGVYVVVSTVDASPPTFTLNGAMRARGDIRAVRGMVEVMGRKFEVQQALVHLREEDPGNPFVNVTASWNAPDGSTIYVDYIGVLSPITRTKLRFRSNPPRTQQETLALLLLGSETGSSLITGSAGAGENTGGNFGDAVGETALGIGGELASQQFNQLLKGIAPLKGLSTRFTTGESGGIKSSLVYQVGDTLSAVASYEGALPGAAGTTGTVAPGASVSVDWRFYKNWLLRASVGTAADVPRGELDLLWQYRY